MYKIIGADEILAKGVTSLAQLRPVLTGNMERREAEGFAVNATLRKDEWEQIDARVNDVMRQRLTIADDLRARGLVSTVSIGTVLRVTERLNDFDEADLSFDGDTDPQEDRPDYARQVIPVPVIAKGFRLNWRQLAASRTRGEPLDVTGAGIATRKVRDRLQSLIVNGYGAGPGANPANGTDGTSIPGLLTAANRLTANGAGVAWNASGADIIGDVEVMLQTAYAKNLFGPFFLYVPKNYWATLQEDYSTLKGDKTFLQRILSFEDIEQVRPLDTLPDSKVVMVQMTEDVIDLTEAQTVTTVQWEKNPFVTNFRVLTIAGPHIKAIQTDAEETINGIIELA